MLFLLPLFRNETERPTEHIREPYYPPLSSFREKFHFSTFFQHSNRRVKAVGGKRRKRI